MPWQCVLWPPSSRGQHPPREGSNSPPSSPRFHPQGHLRQRLESPTELLILPRRPESSRTTTLTVPASTQGPPSTAAGVFPAQTLLPLPGDLARAACSSQSFGGRRRGATESASYLPKATWLAKAERGFRLGNLEPQPTHLHLDTILMCLAPRSIGKFFEIHRLPPPAPSHGRCPLPAARLGWPPPAYGPPGIPSSEPSTLSCVFCPNLPH